MKLIGALNNAAPKKTFNANLEEMSYNLVPQVYGDWDHDKFWEHVKERGVHTWMCTDTLVGLFAIFMDGELIGWRWQRGRKYDSEYKFLSREKAEKLRAFLLECVEEDDVLEGLIATEDELNQELPEHWKGTQ